MIFVWLGFKIDWALESEPEWSPGAVVEGFDLIENGDTSFGEAGKPAVVNQFVFEVARKAFNKSGVGMLL